MPPRAPFRYDEVIITLAAGCTARRQTATVGTFKELLVEESHLDKDHASFPGQLLPMSDWHRGVRPSLCPNFGHL